MAALRPNCCSSIRKLPLYMSSVERLRNEHIVDAVKLSLRPRKGARRLQVTGISNEVLAARDALARDPYDMNLINRLAYMYCIEGHIEKCCNVLLRGWKRTTEFKDPSVGFHFLMKLCELSFVLGHIKQAQAVLQDITEPENPAERKSFFILSCHVHGANKDMQRALRALQKAIDGEDYQMAIRIFALTMPVLKEAGIYMAARSLIEKIGPNTREDPMLSMLDSFASREREPSDRAEEKTRYFLVALTVAFVAMIIYLLYRLEQWSLAGLKH